MNIAVFASGRGSNFQAILSAIHHGQLPAAVRLVVSNKSTAGALEIARAHQIPAFHRAPSQYQSADAYVADLTNLLEEHGVDFIALAGYLKQLPAALVSRFRNRIVNIHPALLPAFGGMGMYGVHVHEAVLAAGVKVSGATVHLVDEEYDRGPILLQRTVEVLPDDTPETLAARVLKIEHVIYPEALAAFAEGRVRIEGRKAWIQPHR